MQPKTPTQWFRWDDRFEGMAERKGQHLCSACGPKWYADGTPTEYGTWHDQFERVFLPRGQFKTNREGNLEHIETGRTDFRAFAITPEQAK
ncbi:hypothetical protein FSO04_24235 [Paraburkholderia madseniana]|uniref:Uncharacterized protein n=2 Tax=Paraburkholderia madseniana TaxID=2599607 RepID=A0A6N6WBU9_9BURK|nr:hypothetical protein FSO04_24235 [Paraburkholderia madseniana]